MTSTTFFLIFIPVLAIILLTVNLIFAPHNPYQEKNSAFECGFHSFLGQNRTQFSISFFIFALLFLLFDLEILLVYPYVVSAYTNGIYGLVIMLIFFLVLTLGFAFELGKNALKIDSKQMINLFKNKPTTYSILCSIFFSQIWKHFTIKNIIKNITITNIILGLIAVIIMALIKYSFLPAFILVFLDLPVSEYYEYIIAGSLALVARLGIKGVAIEIIKETYLNMDGISGPSGTSGTSGPSGPSGTSGPSQKEWIERSKRQSMQNLTSPTKKVFLPEDIVNDLHNMIKNLESNPKLTSEEALRLSSYRKLRRENIAGVEWLKKLPLDDQRKFMQNKQKEWATNELIKGFRNFMHPTNPNNNNLMDIDTITSSNDDNNKKNNNDLMDIDTITSSNDDNNKKN
jgi:NADH-ubiquinone oxidoreductase chain 3